MDFRLKALLMVAVAMLAITSAVSPTIASDPFTRGGSTIENAKPTDTFPIQPGELSVRWENAGGDTTYADTTSSVTTEVDTGYDIVNIVNATQSDSWTYSIAGGDSTQVANGDSVWESGDANFSSVSPGDTLVHAFQIHNRSNNPAPIDFKVSHLLGDTGGLGTDSGPFTVELFTAAGDSTANQFDSSTLSRIPNSDSSTLSFTHGQVKTLFAVVTAGATANDGQTAKSEFFVSNQVNPALGDPNVAGDQWEDGASLPAGTADDNDTQAFVLTTQVAGPDLTISKDIKALTQLGGDSLYRPGDTIQFRITVDNQGGGNANNVIVSDALPDSTTLSDTNTGNNLNGNNLVRTSSYSSVSADETVDNSVSPSVAEKVAWEIEDIPAGSSVELTFRVTID